MRIYKQRVPNRKAFRFFASLRRNEGEALFRISEEWELEKVEGDKAILRAIRR